MKTARTALAAVLLLFGIALIPILGLPAIIFSIWDGGAHFWLICLLLVLLIALALWIAFRRAGR